MSKKVDIVYSPAADRLKKSRRTEKTDLANFVSPIVPNPSDSLHASTPLNSCIPGIDLNRFKNVKVRGVHMDGDEYSEDVSVTQIMSYLEIGRIDEANTCADILYSQFINEEKFDLLSFASYIKILTVLREWQRIGILISKKSLHQTHIFFAYYLLNSMFQRSLYEEVTELPIGHLFQNQGIILPLKCPSTITGKNVSEERYGLHFNTITELDRLASQLNAKPMAALILAESFLKLTNKGAAMTCINFALKHEGTLAFAERLTYKYNLLNPESYESYTKKRITQLASNNKDPRVMAERAKIAYEKGKFKEAKKITDKIFEHFGPYRGCLVLRIHCMTMLGDSTGLLELGHQLVQDDPRSPVAWFCVALYYYVIRSMSKAKSYIGKSTMLDVGFAEAWVAFGHILHYDVEHEQSMSCYYRASKLVDNFAEPYLYVALQYSTHSDKLSKKFMQEAVLRAPNDPFIKHEVACVAYFNHQYEEAKNAFMEILYCITDSGSEECLESVLGKDIDPFWKPLINNLGHIMRYYKDYPLAIAFFKKSLSLDPKYVDAIATLAICYGIEGDIHRSIDHFNRAMAIDPFDETIRQCMAKVISHTKNEFAVPVILEDESMPITDALKKELVVEILQGCGMRKPRDDAHVVKKVPIIEFPTMKSFSPISRCEMAEELAAIVGNLQHLQNLPIGLSKYEQLLLIIEEIGRDIRPTYTSNRVCAERLKRSLTNARVLLRECMQEADADRRKAAESAAKSHEK